jgi:hypothetical protein
MIYLLLQLGALTVKKLCFAEVDDEGLNIFCGINLTLIADNYCNCSKQTKRNALEPSNHLHQPRRKAHATHSRANA